MKQFRLNLLLFSVLLILSTTTGLVIVGSQLTTKGTIATLEEHGVEFLFNQDGSIVAIDSPAITLKQLQLLKALNTRDVRQVIVRNSKLDSICLQWIRQCASAEVIVLRDCTSVTEARLGQVLGNSPATTALHLLGSDISSVNDLRSANLEKLSLDKTEVDDIGISRMRIPKLKTLSISGSPISSNGVSAFLANHPDLLLLECLDTQVDVSLLNQYPSVL